MSGRGSVRGAVLARLRCAECRWIPFDPPPARTARDRRSVAPALREHWRGRARGQMACYRARLRRFAPWSYVALRLGYVSANRQQPRREVLVVRRLSSGREPRMMDLPQKTSVSTSCIDRRLPKARQMSRFCTNAVMLFALLILASCG